MNKPLKIFITYAYTDKAEKGKLVTHLDVLVREGLIADWNDNEITPGDTWRDPHLQQPCRIQSTSPPCLRF